MSLAIDVDKISAVLLADGWHKVFGESFVIDSYEFVENPNEKSLDGRSDAYVLHGGGENGVCASGFSFYCDEFDRRISGPITSILAVKELN